MENGSGLWPIPRELLIKAVEHAKTYPTIELVQCQIDFLNEEFRGTNNPEAFEQIDSIRKHFKEDARQQQFNAVKISTENYLNQYFGGIVINANDEQIETAIILTKSIFESKRDWAPIYIILKDFCGWPAKKTDFKTRVERLNLKKLPSKYVFDYTAMRQGLESYWPLTYREWLAYSPNSNDRNVFEHRKEVATKFLENLRMQVGKPLSNHY